MNKILLATATFALVAGAAPLSAQQATTKDQLIGSWKVLSLKATTSDRVSYPLGEHVAGYVTVTPDRFWLLFVDATRKAPAAATLTDAEAVAMMKSHAWCVRATCSGAKLFMTGSPKTSPVHWGKEESRWRGGFRRLVLAFAG